MKKIISIIIVVLIAALSACNKDTDINKFEDRFKDEIIFNLSFDDISENLVTEKVSDEKVKINYILSSGTYQDARDVKVVKDSAILGKALNFDGYSNYIEFEDGVFSYDGKEFSLDLFIAPRAYEWDEPKAIENGTDNLMVVIGQYNLEKKEGFVFGLHKYGDYSFQIGNGKEWIKLYNEWNRLDRKKWNHITLTYSASNGYMAMYRDGELVNDLYGLEKLPIKQASSNLYIGKSTYPEKTGMFELNMFNGLMDEVRLYDVSLNADDVYELYKGYKGYNYKVVDRDVDLDYTIVENDIYHPTYHATPAQHWMNEPHALFLYKEYYHLFCQHNPIGPYWRQIEWGHWVSVDMINWFFLGSAIVMDENTPIKDGAWSGCASYKKDGTPVLFITAGDDGRIYNSHSNQNIVIATPKDLNDPYLREWNISSTLSAKLTPQMGVANEFRDPNVYYEDGTYYMVVGSESTGYKPQALLFKTEDDSFLNWEYVGPLFTLNKYEKYYGTTFELPNLVKVYTDDKRHSKYLFAFSPSGANADNDIYYFLGNFDKKTNRFIPDSENAQLMDYGNNVFTGPTISVNPMDGRVIICSILQDQKSGKMHYNSGYAFMAGLPRELYLTENLELGIREIEEIQNNVGETLIEENNSSIENINKKLKDIYLDLLRIEADIKNINATEFGFSLYVSGKNKALLTYKTNEQYIFINTRNCPLNIVKGEFGGIVPLKNGKLHLVIYIDKSTCEVYINDLKCLSFMCYNNNYGVNMFSSGNVSIEHIKVNVMKGIDRSKFLK